MFGTKDPSELSIQERRFVHEMCINPTSFKHAALRAGYSPVSAHTSGSRLMKRKRIIDAIDEANEKTVKQMGFSKERIIQELAAIAFADLSQSIKYDENGDPVSGPTTETSVEVSNGKVKTRLTKVKTAKLADKINALVQMGKHLGMFKDQVEVSGHMSLIDLVTQSMAQETSHPVPETEDELAES